MGLLLRRGVGETLVIRFAGAEVRVTVLDYVREREFTQAKLLIDAPEGVAVDREEIAEEKDIAAEVRAGMPDALIEATEAVIKQVLAERRSRLREKKQARRRDHAEREARNEAVLSKLDDAIALAVV